jgi:hypothetical protein
MEHFLDEAERREQELKKNIKPTIIQNDVEKNNHLLYQDFHKKLVDVITKISNLSSESRKPIVEIGFTYLENDNRYEYYASAYRIITVRKFFFFKKEKIYNWWRRVIIEVSSTFPDEITVKVHEKGTSETNPADIIKKKLKTKTKISKLNNETILWITDYLGYKASAHTFISYINSLNSSQTI